MRATHIYLAKIRPFHLAVPVNSVPKARNFYGGLLQCVEGRRDGNVWQDYNFFGHQLVVHHVGPNYNGADFFNDVDNDAVPVPHFGVCLTIPQFRTLEKRLKAYNAISTKSGRAKFLRSSRVANKSDPIEWVSPIKFMVEPHLRFEGMPGAQYTMFFKDPSGNNLEFKAMLKDRNLFAKYDVAKTK